MKNKNKKLRSPSAKKTQKKKIILFVSLAVILIAAMVLVAIFLPRGKTTPDKDSVTTLGKSDAASAQGKVPEPAEPVYAHGTAFSFSKTGEAAPSPQFVNPLTGLESSKDLSKTRPCAIMINNIHVANPQEGVSGADILYECLAEGGITRLLMVSTDYSSLGVIGSVRSSREYFIDFAKNHDAIYIHAGGSEEAYSQILSRKIDHIDGVRADARTGNNLTGTVFYRDPDRRAKMGLEHSMMTTGEKLSEGISIMNYRTSVSEDFENPIHIIDWGWKVDLSGEEASHIKIPYRSTHIAEFEYDSASNKYLRYQFNHEKHIDNTTGEQLAFTNVIVLNIYHENRGDSYNHLNVYTTGNGEGYYFTGGKMIPIKWSKATQDSPFELTDADGYPLVLNKGKTMINIADDTVYADMTFN